MKILWAPWRKKYIMKYSKNKGCFLCKAFKEKKDKSNYIVYRGKHIFIILNKYPYNNGHLMVSTNKHNGDISELNTEQLYELIETVSLAVKALKKEYLPEGFNVGLNLGRCAGAGVEGHLHVHIVPRWSGDTNFMPVTSGNKVISEKLEDTYKKMKKYFKGRDR